MIPKIIHYCWFGGSPEPDDVKQCIASWRKYLLTIKSNGGTKLIMMYTKINI